MYRVNIICSLVDNRGNEVMNNMPDGCIGVSPVFLTKKQARKAFGKNVSLEEIRIKEEED